MRVIYSAEAGGTGGGCALPPRLSGPFAVGGFELFLCGFIYEWAVPLRQVVTVTDTEASSAQVPVLVPVPVITS